MSDAPNTCVALLTAGRSAPCFGPAIGGFLQRYKEYFGDDFGRKVQLIAYRHGFRGLLRGDVVKLGEQEVIASGLFAQQGGSPIGTSRTRLTNLSHLKLRGLVSEGEDPHERAAQQLMNDRVTVFHVVGSADAQITAQRLSSLLSTKYHYTLHVVGLAKTIENDMWPLRMTLGASTAAEQGAAYFENVVPEHNSNPRMLIIHEIKGRAAGWLTAATAKEYRERLDRKKFPSSFGLSREVFDVHAVYTPEMLIDFDSEIPRLRRCMDKHDNVNIFLAQGTAKDQIAEEEIARGQTLKRHAVLGYPLIDTAKWLASKLKTGIGAEKVLIQRSGIFVRSAAAGMADLILTQSCVNFAVEIAAETLSRQNTLVLRGVVGHDERLDGQLRLVETEAFIRKRPLDLTASWVTELLSAVGQPQESAGRIRWRRAQEEKLKQSARKSKL